MELLAPLFLPIGTENFGNAHWGRKNVHKFVYEIIINFTFLL